jgi:hypothetical protein
MQLLLDHLQQQQQQQMLATMLKCWMQLVLYKSSQQQQQQQQQMRGSRWQYRCRQQRLAAAAAAFAAAAAAVRLAQDATAVQLRRCCRGHLPDISMPGCIEPQVCHAAMQIQHLFMLRCSCRSALLLITQQQQQLLHCWLLALQRRLRLLT